jgi:hypothetical protein
MHEVGPSAAGFEDVQRGTSGTASKQQVKFIFRK